MLEAVCGRCRRGGWPGIIMIPEPGARQCRGEPGARPAHLRQRCRRARRMSLCAGAKGNVATGGAGGSVGGQGIRDGDWTREAGGRRGFHGGVDWAVVGGVMRLPLRWVRLPLICLPASSPRRGERAGAAPWSPSSPQGERIACPKRAKPIGLVGLVRGFQSILWRKRAFTCKKRAA